MGKSDKKKGELIEKGVKVVTSENEPVKLNYLISDAGGQGDVYHVSFKGHDYAMKWYCKNADDVIGGAQYHTISKIWGEDKKPSVKFVWPLFLVTEENPCKGKQFGYLMELLPKNYYEMNDYLRMDGDASAVRFKSYNAMMVAGSFWVYPEREIEIVEGMTIQLENGKIIKIVNGLVDGPKKTVSVTTQDVLNDPISDAITDNNDIDEKMQAVMTVEEAEAVISNPEGKDG